MVSIIIPSFDSSAFLKECIESIRSSSFHHQYEILIGIDHCQSTLDYIKENNQEFKDVTVLYFQKNVGPYVIKNTLVDLAKNEKILFFDSDDIMNSDTLDSFNEEIDNYDFVRLTYRNFDTDSKNIGSIESEILSDAVIGIKKSVFNELNGFYPWRCAADSEFSERLVHFQKIGTTLSGISYNRRIHENNLTVKKDTNLKSKKRSGYRFIIGENRKKGDWPNPEIKYTEDYNKIEL